MKMQPVSFVVQSLFFSVKLLGFVSKAIKFLLTELVCQCRNILPLAFSVLTSLSFAELEMDKTVHSEFYLPLSGRSKHQFQQNISIL